MTPASARKTLAVLLYLMGGLAALAVVPMVMPTAWMVATNDWLGLGPFPHAPLTQYLTRSLSAVYALLGVLVLYVARHVDRYLDLVQLMGWVTMALGLFLTGLDFAVGMPAAWSWGEGPPTVVVGAAFVWLARQSRAPAGEHR